MSFGKKLKQAMEEKEVNLTTLHNYTSIPKSSISQYMRDITAPPEARKKMIADVLCLSENYFYEEAKVFETADCKIQRLSIDQTAKILGISRPTLEKGLIDGIFPWGYAVQTTPNRWTYIINGNKLAEVECINL